MAYKVLYRKYRPEIFKDVVGQETIVRILKNSIKNETFSHAYLFTGPRGTGKTSTAKILAKAINCLNNKDGDACGKCANCLKNETSPDIIEIDAASNNGVNEIRELRNNVKVSPTNLKYKVYIIDEMHMLTTEAFNAFLKTLEEPPKHVVFILATTDVQKIPLTILSRCQRYDFCKISVDDIVNNLKYISKKESIDITAEALREIAFISDGAMRDALSNLDQLKNYNSNTITIDTITKKIGYISQKDIEKIAKAIQNNDSKTIVKNIENLRDGGIQAHFLLEKLIDSCSNEAINTKLSGNNNDYFEKMKNVVLNLLNTQQTLKNVSNPFLVLELSILSTIDNTFKELITNKEEMENNKNKLKKVNSLEKETKKKLINSDISANILDEIVKIRINNCFVEPDKEFVNQLRKIWKKYIMFLKTDDLELLNILIDTNIEASSKSNMIISCDNTNIADIINSRLKEIEKKFYTFSEIKIKIIAISKKRWIEEKDIFVKNKKNKIQYELQKEPRISSSEIRKNYIEEIAESIFGNDILIK